jgi:hydrogenase/urease accessory protein HupE
MSMTERPVALSTVLVTPTTTGRVRLRYEIEAENKAVVAATLAARVCRWLEPLLAVAALAVMAHHPGVSAHEARPAYLELTEALPDRYDVVWRAPVLAGMRLPVVLQLPAGASDVVVPRVRELPDSIVERRIITASGGLGGKRIEFVGLQGTITDVLVRVQTRDGATSTTLVHPSQPWVIIAATRGSLAVAGAYLMHGIDHILFGYDHLLFVFALILIVPKLRVLVTTVTTFTLAHSITLALATLDIVRVPAPPVEAAVALSILLLASEIVRSRAGQPSLTARWPWFVAFSFGLLHGFGFASALSEIGLPRGDIPLALLTFNVGVEIGQLIFIAAVLALLALARRVPVPDHVSWRAQSVANYTIGVLAAFWLVERVAGFLS